MKVKLYRPNGEFVREMFIDMDDKMLMVAKIYRKYMGDVSGRLLPIISQIDQDTYLIEPSHFTAVFEK